MVRKKILTGIATGTILLGALTPLAFADTSANVGGVASLSSPVESVLAPITGVVQGVVSNLGLGTLLGGTSISAGNQTSVTTPGANVQSSTGASVQL